ncbi:unnamed protein product [Cuscuta europaea]|uniref:Uncharacterized protein n=1 Tax=Cuscuta europaea TaxID=41803 RepID=A0A9P1E6L8_CUSEU|nr:unnamed protein product [Cuscuta europaea]
MKNKRLVVEVADSRMVASKTARGEAYAVMVIIASWIVFGILSYLK